MRSFALLFLLAVGQAVHGQSSLLIEAHAPGRDSGTIEQQILTPLEQQLRGLEPVRRLRGLALDGRCLIRLDFAKEADPELVRLLVQNRIALAKGKLPPSCTTAILPLAEGAFMLITSEPAGDMTLADTSSLVNNLVWPVLASVPGVAHIHVVGATNDKVRVGLDPHKLSRYKLSEDEVVRAIEFVRAIRRSFQNVEDLTIHGQKVIVKKTETLRDLPNIPVLRDSEGRTIFLSDVASVHLTDEAREDCRITLREEKELRTRRGVFVLVHLAPGKLNPLAKKGLENALHDLRLPTKLPDGVLCEGQLLPVDTTTVVMRFRETKDLAQRAKKAQQAVKAMLELPQVRKVFSLVPSGDGEAVFWILADRVKKADFAKDLRAKLAAIKGVSSRVSALYSPLFPWPGKGAPIVVRLQGKNFVKLQQTGELLHERLRKTAGLVDVASFPRMHEAATIEVDRAKVLLSKLTMRDVHESLAAHADNIEFPIFGSSSRLVVEVPKGSEKKPKNFVEEIEKLPISHANPDVNLMIGDVADVRLIRVPGGIIPHENGGRCVLITANLKGRAREEARTDIRRIAQDLAKEGVHIEVE